MKLTMNAANLPVASLKIEKAIVNGNSDNLASMLCGSEDNINLTRKQRHLLMWHNRLGHASFKLIRWLGRNNYLYGGEVDQDSTILCDSCRLARAAKRPVEKNDLTPSSTVKSGEQLKFNSIKNNDLQPGDCVSIDQYSSQKRGRLSKGFGKAPTGK